LSDHTFTPARFIVLRALLNAECLDGGQYFASTGSNLPTAARLGRACALLKHRSAGTRQPSATAASLAGAAVTKRLWPTRARVERSMPMAPRHRVCHCPPGRSLSANVFASHRGRILAGRAANQRSDVPHRHDTSCPGAGARARLGARNLSPRNVGRGGRRSRSARTAQLLHRTATRRAATTQPTNRPVGGLLSAGSVPLVVRTRVTSDPPRRADDR
jgi:hypothetical protein